MSDREDFADSENATTPGGRIDTVARLSEFIFRA